MESRFCFDLQGFLVVREALAAAQVDAIAALMRARLPADRAPGELTLDGILAWGPAMAAIIDLPRVLAVLVAVLGSRLRLDHEYGIAMRAGDGRGPLHGGDGGMPGWWYRCKDGVIRTGMASVLIALTDAAPGDGGFCCIPGSHKSGLIAAREGDDRVGFLAAIPDAVRTFAAPADYLIQPALRAGDAVVFTEALVHGTQPWSARDQRLALLLKYTPGHCIAAAARSAGPDPAWLSPRQRAMLAAPALYGSDPIAL